MKADLFVLDGAPAADQAARPTISVVMPCLNEQDGVGQCVERALEGIARTGLAGEVVVCDNGSTDASVKVAEAAGARVVHQPERGYGNAYLKGFAEAHGTYIVMGDADGTYDFSELHHLVAKLEEGHDYVLGSRFAGRILPGAMPWPNRYIGNPVLTGILNRFFGLRTSDAHSGMRAFTRDARDRMALCTEGMEFASEIVIKASHAGLRMAEVPITYHAREGDSKLHPARDAWRHVRFMLLICPRYLFFVPGSVLFALGMVGQTALLSGPLPLGFHSLDSHFSALFALLAILGYQTLLFGLFTKAYTRNRRLSGDDRLMDWIERDFTLERGLVVGFMFFVAGVIIDGVVLVDWIGSSMGPIMAIRPALYAMTLMVVGAQTAFGSFFLSLFRMPANLGAVRRAPSDAPSDEVEQVA